MYRVSQYIYSNLVNNNKTMAIFLDLAKSFDIVNHDIILKILPSFGIKRSSLNLFKIYLHNSRNK